MRIFILIYAFFCSFQHVKGQHDIISHLLEAIESQGYNKLSDRGERKGKWIEVCYEGPFSHGHHNEYEGHRIGDYVDGKRKGIWKGYWENILLYEAIYENGSLNGVANFYQTRESQLYMQLSFSNGVIEEYRLYEGGELSIVYKCQGNYVTGVIYISPVVPPSSVIKKGSKVDLNVSYLCFYGFMDGY